MAVWDNFDSESMKNDLDADSTAYHKDETSLTSMGGAMANELVKSYGLRRDAKTGDWSWSLGNIAEAFREDPFWTTLDYASLLFAPAKYGLALRSVAKGAGAFGKAYRALKTGEAAVDALEVAGTVLKGKKPASLLGRAFTAFGGDEVLAAATDMSLKSGVSKLHAFRLPGAGDRVFSLASPIASRPSEEFMQLVDKFGAEIHESKVIAKSFERERLVGEAMFARRAEDISRQWQAAGLTDVQQKAAVRALGVRMDESRMLRFTDRMFKDNTQASEAYRATWAFRNTTH